MRLLCLAVAVAAATLSPPGNPASAADVETSRSVKRAPAVARPPLALRTLSRRSASVLASMPCWHGCTTQCGWNFQACLRIGRLDGCLDANNDCELSCLKQCRLSGGPLVSWTDY